MKYEIILTEFKDELDQAIESSDALRQDYQQ